MISQTLLRRIERLEAQQYAQRVTVQDGLERAAERLEKMLHPKQRQVFESPARQLFFAGASGPGKSTLLRIAAIVWACLIPGLQVYLFRRKFPDLHLNHWEGPTSLPALVREIPGVQANYTTHSVTFPNGSRIHLRHMQHEKDVASIQGAEIHVALVDELTQFSKSQYAFIRSRVRMAGVSVPVAWQARFPRIVAASNPGGVSHNSVKALFIDPAPPGEIWMAPEEEGGLTTQFIPALLSDNPSLTESDPDYAQRLKGLGDPALVRAMLEGDWSVVSGGALDDVWQPDVHIIDPFPIPKGWLVNRSFDWGSSHPFAVCWWAESDGTDFARADGSHQYTVKGDLFLFSEWYGWNGRPNEGSRMLAREVARGIKEREKDMGVLVKPGPADSAIYTTEDGRSIADEMASIGVTWTAANKSPGSRKHGLQLLRTRLHGALPAENGPREDPGLFVFNNCRHTVRTLPTLPRSDRDAEDVDTNAEDHIYDAIRYRLLDIRKTIRQVRLLGL